MPPDDAADLSRQANAVFATDPDEAERLYRRAVELDADNREAWFGLSLLYKWRREWAPCLTASERTIALTDPAAWPGNEACWNAGLAATGARNWRVARESWRRYGLRVAGEGGARIEEDYGPGVLRAVAGERFVGLWGWRIDPCRMRVTSVPVPETGHRWGDVVLHDREPVGQRAVDKDRFEVYEAIATWQRSSVGTVEAVVSANPAAVVALVAAAQSAGWVAEVWTDSVFLDCPVCSYGATNATHRHRQSRKDAPQRIGIAGPPDRIAVAVDEWSRWRRDRVVMQLGVVA